MTNKEEMEKEYSDWVVKRHEDFGSFPTTAECGHYWLSKIEQIRKEDMKELEKELNSMSYAGVLDSNEKRRGYDIAIQEALFVIKQTHE